MNYFLKSELTDGHSEELLVAHEKELERLRGELKSKSRILVSVKKYKEICDEEKELAVGLSVFMDT
jgi:Ase1/PRC1/MAP65 family protein